MLLNIFFDNLVAVRYSETRISGGGQEQSSVSSTTSPQMLPLKRGASTTVLLLLVPISTFAGSTVLRTTPHRRGIGKIGRGKKIRKSLGNGVAPLFVGVPYNNGHVSACHPSMGKTSSSSSCLKSR